MQARRYSNSRGNSVPLPLVGRGAGVGGRASGRTPERFPERAAARQETAKANDAGRKASLGAAPENRRVPLPQAMPDGTLHLRLRRVEPALADRTRWWNSRP